ncbi:hypothetical protein N7G274_001633 [Stereocaulon virgatum]|uniref:Uncharacterized protein n=1 Tax=Stereocaulon virgatum TaxID=373712 RepID=A0ABR4AN00_9LECA
MEVGIPSVEIALGDIAEVRPAEVGAGKTPLETLEALAINTLIHRRSEHPKLSDVGCEVAVVEATGVDIANDENVLGAIVGVRLAAVAIRRPVELVDASPEAAMLVGVVGAVLVEADVIGATLVESIDENATEIVDIGGATVGVLPIETTVADILGVIDEATFAVVEGLGLVTTLLLLSISVLLPMKLIETLASEDADRLRQRISAQP